MLAPPSGRSLSVAMPEASVIACLVTLPIVTLTLAPDTRAFTSSRTVTARAPGALASIVRENGAEVAPWLSVTTSVAV